MEGLAFKVLGFKVSLGLGCQGFRVRVWRSRIQGLVFKLGVSLLYFGAL